MRDKRTKELVAVKYIERGEKGKSIEEEMDIKVMEKPNRFTLPTSPTFVFPHGRRERYQTCFTIKDGHYSTKSIPNLRGMVCLGSSHGWLILLNKYHSKCYLINPVSLEKIQLPSIEDFPRALGVLTSSPSDPNCLVMLINTKNNICLFCRPGDKQWIRKELNSKKKPDDHIKHIRSAISFKGKIYIDFLAGIAVMDVCDTYVTIKTFKKENFEEVIFSIPDEKPFKDYFVESCGELFLVTKIHLGYYQNVVETIDVFKLDVSSMVRVKVESLGDRVILLGDNSCVSTSVSATDLGVKGDCIYFFQPEDRSLYRFDMCNRTISVSLPCPNVVRRWSEPYWVLPNLCSLVRQGTAEIEGNIKGEIRGDEKPWNNFPREILDSNKRAWMDIPRDILELIVSRLFLGDCIRFHLTCQAWTAITSPLRTPPHPFQSKSPQQSPWLMFFPKNNGGLCKFFHPMFNDPFVMDFPELLGATFRHSKYGWLLMSRGESFFFFNPFTRETINLPNMSGFAYRMVSISFSSPPTSSDCIVFGLALPYTKFVTIVECRHGKDTWTSYMIDSKVPFVTSFCNPIFYDGVFFCLDKDGKLGVFDPKEELEEHLWRVHPKLIGPNFSIYKTFIAECDGEILSVFVGRLGKPIYVCRLDRLQMKWVKLETLGNKMLFLSHTTSLLAHATTEGTENKIYFPRFHRENIVFYSLWTSRYHSFGGNYSKEDWYDTEEQWFCTWIEPNLHSSVEEELDWLANPPQDEQA